ncbi:glycosyl transferase family protein [Raoultella terrigena]|uniref:Glycosyl transferase family protein n=1 Tax=Raoultella terrigena TaxID=577 RepID=A0A4U9DC32_RAOTE|nr:glycosyl transferase family protein [Raoultella terrigena]
MKLPNWSWGAILIALRIKGEGEAEMRGFYEAMQQQTLRLTPAGSAADADCDPQLQRRA